MREIESFSHISCAKLYPMCYKIVSLPFGKWLWRGGRVMKMPLTPYQAGMRAGRVKARTYKAWSVRQIAFLGCTNRPDTCITLHPCSASLCQMGSGAGMGSAPPHPHRKVVKPAALLEMRRERSPSSCLLAVQEHKHLLGSAGPGVVCCCTQRWRGVVMWGVRTVPAAVLMHIWKWYGNAAVFIY